MQKYIKILFFKIFTPSRKNGVVKTKSKKLEKFRKATGQNFFTKFEN